MAAKNRSKGRGRSTSAGISGITTRQVSKQYGQATKSGLRGKAAESAAFSSGAGGGG
jgi:hypothetical protein